MPLAQELFQLEDITSEENFYVKISTKNSAFKETDIFLEYTFI